MRLSLEFSRSSILPNMMPFGPPKSLAQPSYNSTSPSCRVKVNGITTRIPKSLAACRQASIISRLSDLSADSPFAPIGHPFRINPMVSPNTAGLMIWPSGRKLAQKGSKIVPLGVPLLSFITFRNLWRQPSEALKYSTVFGFHFPA